MQGYIKKKVYHHDKFARLIVSPYPQPQVKDEDDIAKGRRRKNEEKIHTKMFLYDLWQRK